MAAGDIDNTVSGGDNAEMEEAARAQSSYFVRDTAVVGLDVGFPGEVNSVVAVDWKGV